MFSHEAHLKRRVEEGLSELTVADSEAARASKHVASHLVFVWEHKHLSTVGGTIFPKDVLLHLLRVETV